MAPRVVRISVAPVKSLGLVHPEEVMLEPGGVVGNRRFWLRDEQGALYAGKRDGSLMQIRPEWDEETRRLALTFPDGERVDGVVELGEEIEANLYSWNRLRSRKVHGPWEAAISDYVGRPLEFLWADEGAVDRTPRGGPITKRLRSTARRFCQALWSRPEQSFEPEWWMRWEPIWSPLLSIPSCLCRRSPAVWRPDG